MGDRIEVPIGLDYFEVTSTVLVDGFLEVAVESTFPRACFHCGSTKVISHGRSQRRIRDRMCAHPTVLVWRQRRLRCNDCGRTSRERHPGIPERKRISRRFAQQLAELSCAEPWTDIARREAVSWWRVANAFEQLASGVDTYTGPPPRVISLDEACFRRRYFFHTVLTAPTQHRVLDLVPGRSQSAAQKALERLPADWKETIETVVIDLFWPYRKAVEKILPRARIVADKFHVLRAVDTAAQKVRVGHARNKKVAGPRGGLAKQSHPRFDPHLWRIRWLFMRRRNRLTQNQREHLEKLFESQPQVGVAWWLKEAFHQIYQAPNRDEAQRRLTLWTYHIEQAHLPQFTDLWRNLSFWSEQILNYFDHPHTNGYAEGITNKIKVLKRRGYGHTNPHRYRAKVLLATNHQPG